MRGGILQGRRRLRLRQRPGVPASIRRLWDADPDQRIASGLRSCPEKVRSLKSVRSRIALARASRSLRNVATPRRLRPYWYVCPLIGFDRVTLRTSQAVFSALSRQHSCCHRNHTNPDAMSQAGQPSVAELTLVPRLRRTPGASVSTKSSTSHRIVCPLDSDPGQRRRSHLRAQRT